MTLIVLTWIVLVELEAVRNWYIIIKKKKSPKHKWRTVLRIVVGIVFWIATPIIYHDLPYDSWWAMPMMMGFTFWWLFDSSLNLMRGRKIWYLGDPSDPEEDSKLDEAQLKAFGAFPAFFFKLMFAGVSTTAFYYGLNAVLGIS